MKNYQFSPPTSTIHKFGFHKKITYDVDAWRQYMINITNERIMNETNHRQSNLQSWMMDDQPVKWWLIIRMDNEYLMKGYTQYNYKNVKNICSDLKL